MIKGRDIMVFANGKAIAVARNCTIQKKYDLIEVSSPSSGIAKEYIPGRYEWGINISNLVAVDGFSKYVMKAGNILNITVGKVDSQKHLTTDGLRGTCICDQTNVNAEIGKLANGTLSLKGTGPLFPLQYTKEVSVIQAIKYDPFFIPRTPGMRFTYDVEFVYNRLWKSDLVPTPQGKPMMQTTEVTPSDDTAYIYMGVAYVWRADLEKFVNIESYDEED